jgi:hypothetical protein
MLRTFVSGKNKMPIMLCQSARVWVFLLANKVPAYSYYPFIAILHQSIKAYVSRLSVKTTHSKTTILNNINNCMLAAMNISQINNFNASVMAKAIISTGNKIGDYFGKAVFKAFANFNIKIGATTIQEISFKYCKLLQYGDGYNYNLGGGV